MYHHYYSKFKLLSGLQRYFVQCPMPLFLYISREEKKFFHVQVNLKATKMR